MKLPLVTKLSKTVVKRGTDGIARKTKKSQGNLSPPSQLMLTCLFLITSSLRSSTRLFREWGVKHVLFFCLFRVVIVGKTKKKRVTATLPPIADSESGRPSNAPLVKKSISS